MPRVDKHIIEHAENRYGYRSRSIFWGQNGTFYQTTAIISRHTSANVSLGKQLRPG